MTREIFILALLMSVFGESACLAAEQSQTSAPAQLPLRQEPGQSLLLSTAKSPPALAAPQLPISASQLVEGVHANNPAAKSFAAGMMAGMIAFEIEALDDAVPIYCAPGNLPLTGDTLVEVIAKTVTQKPELRDQPAGAVAVIALKETYPCAGSAK